MQERVKTENNLATQAVYEHVCIYLFASFRFCIYLYFYFQYLSLRFKKNIFVLKYSKYHIL